MTELDNRRPLIPMDWQPSGNVQKVLDTCRVIAALQERLGAYVVSMAREPFRCLVSHSAAPGNRLSLQHADCPTV